MKKFVKDKGIYILAFCVPWIVILIHSLIRQAWPFYDGCIMGGDCGKQYYQLFVELWNKVHSKGSLFFSWNAGGGFDFMLNLMYYLVSPFTFLILIVPKSMLEDTIQVVMVLKWSAMYVSMLYYFMHTEFNRVKTNKRFMAFVLASIFALSNCTLYRFTLFNWHDSVILFPILLLLLEKMIRDGSWKLYTITLWAAIICNFYTTFQICIFLVLWFFFCINKDTSNKIKSFLKFAGASVLSAGAAAIVIIPSLLNSFKRSSMTEEMLRLYRSNYIDKMLVDVWGVLEKIFLFDDLSDPVTGKPAMYFSIGALILLGVYLGVKSRYKIKAALIVAILIASIFVGRLSYVWHGFSIPHGRYHRFLFLLVFICSFIVMDLFNNIETLQFKKSAIALGVELIVIVSAFLHIQDLSNFYGYFFTFLLFVFYCIIFVLYNKKSIGLNIFLYGCGVVIICELMINGVYEFKEYDNYEVETFYDTADAKKLISDNITTGKDERISVINGMTNDGLLFDAPVQDLFLSYCDGDHVRMARNLGMPYFDDASYMLYGASPLINLIYNVRYAVANSDLCVAGMDKTGTSGNVSLYENSRIAGLGYMVDENLLNWDYEKYNQFNSQNIFVQLAVGEDDIFETVYPEVVFGNNETIECDQDYLEKGCYKYTYKAFVAENNEYTIMSAYVPDDMDMYIAVNNGAFANTYVFIDDKQVLADNEEYLQQVIHVGKVKKNQKVVILTTRDSLKLGMKNTMMFRFASFNEEAYEKAYKKLSNNTFNIDIMKDDYVKGSIHADKDGLMMTSIPAMDGFSVNVDGKKTDYKKVGAFIAVPMSAGKHQVEFKYMTPYFKEGAIISLAGILVYVLLCVVTFVKKKEDNKKAA